VVQEAIQGCSAATLVVVLGTIHALSWLKNTRCWRKGVIKCENVTMTQKILVVEDDLALASTVELVLKTNGFETVLCARGDTALQVFRDSKPDLILLDVMLPGKNGFEVARDIRQESDVPIIMVTAKTETEDIVRGLESSGADDYLTKPYPPRVLLARIRARLRKHENHPVAIKDIVIDTKGHLVTRDGVEIILTSTEFKLLKFFASNPGVVFQRDRILTDVWGYQSTDDTRLVNVHIQRLRSKIEHDPENPEIILTVRGVGYKAAE
jgi:two-component system response regulator MtrA